MVTLRSGPRFAPMPDLSAQFDPHLLAPIEDAGLNASAPTQQRWLGGWLLRLAPGKSRRTRCVDALAVGPLPLDEVLQRAEASYMQSGLPFIVRITPFSQPAELDARLAARGHARIDDVRVMVRTGLGGVQASASQALAFESLGHGAFAQALGALRESPLASSQAHAERLRTSAVPYSGVLLRDQGVPVACGQYALEDDLVGLYDIYTAEPFRGRGLAGLVCEHLLRQAHVRGARTAYLQVDACNKAARGVYARLGFRDAYAFHYRGKYEE